MADEPALKLEVVNLAEVQEVFTEMRDKLDAFAPISGDSEMSHELRAWQVEDMHRHFPNVEVPDPWTALTRIWPRSRKSKAHRPGVARGPRQPRLRLVLPGGKPLMPTRSHRPILRPELFDKLCERMAAMMREKLTWR